MIFYSVEGDVLIPDCACDHVGGFTSHSGCILAKGAPEGYACKCKSAGVACWGEIVDCPEGAECIFRDRSRQACHNGGGDCDGYTDDGTHLPKWQ